MLGPGRRKGQWEDAGEQGWGCEDFERREAALRVLAAVAEELARGGLFRVPRGEGLPPPRYRFSRPPGGQCRRRGAWRCAGCGRNSIAGERGRWGAGLARRWRGWAA